MQNYLPRLQQMQICFDSGATKTYQYRKQQLQNLKEALYKYENDIYEALYTDLKKNKEECWITEIGFVITEINFALRNLKKWMKKKRVRTNLLNFPGSSYILHEPLGVTLIIGPWNYPLNLLLTPLVGAIASGNCVVVKPSEFAPATATIIKKILEEIFSADYIFLAEGEGATVIPGMMNSFRFDHVFFTGSETVGTAVYEMAAKKLVPVTLELGGKSPCIIDKDANIKIAAKRIAVTKFSNVGQMCVAPDYVLVHQKIKQEFVEELKKRIESYYSSSAVKDYHYGKVVNKKQFDRLVKYMEDGKIIYGGRHDAKTLFIEPTLIEDPSLDSVVMKEEIFGPVLPIISWNSDEEVENIIVKNKNPLALYVFASGKTAEKWIDKISFGGGCINNASWHLTNYNLPFGGRGNSGIGAYHGHYSFQTFSHKKSIMKTPTWFDPSVKYPPYKGKLNLFKKFIK